MSVNESENRGGLTNWPPQTGKSSSNNSVHHCYCTDQIIELHISKRTEQPIRGDAAIIWAMLKSDASLLFRNYHLIEKVVIPAPSPPLAMTVVQVLSSLKEVSGGSGLL